MPFFKKVKDKKDASVTCFLKNGSALLEGLIATFDGRGKIPIRCFSAEELVTATNNFSECIIKVEYHLFRGSLGGRPVLVTKPPAAHYRLFEPRFFDEEINNIVITSQMSHLKNILKLIGCCLEFKHPALVYEDPEGHHILSDLLFNSNLPRSHCLLLSWRDRLLIASGLANAIAYLNAAFPTPIIHRDLKPQKILLDKHLVPKLFDFSFAIMLPPGELQVEDTVLGTYGFVDPEYVSSGRVTQKTDVYSFGVLALVILTGKWPWDHECQTPNVVSYVLDHVERGQVYCVVDDKISEECRGLIEEEQVKGFVELALRCTRDQGEDRPDMIDVAKELRRIMKLSTPLPGQN